MTIDDQLRDALAGYDPPRRTDFDATQAVEIAHRRHNRRRIARAGAIVACLLLVAAGAWTIASRRSSSGRGTDLVAVLETSKSSETGATTNADPREVEAHRSARALLAAFVPPKGSTATPPTAPLTDLPLDPATKNLVDLHQSWRVPGDARSLAASMRQHPPDQLQAAGSSQDSGPHGATVYRVDFWPPGSTGVAVIPTFGGAAVVLEEGVVGGLEVSMADIGHGEVALEPTRWSSGPRRAPRLIWYRQVRSCSPSLTSTAPTPGAPSDARRSPTAPPSPASRTCSNGLPAQPEGIVMCGGSDAYYSLTFTLTPNSAPAATAVVESDGC